MIGQPIPESKLHEIERVLNRTEGGGSIYSFGQYMVEETPRLIARLRELESLIHVHGFSGKTYNQMCMPCGGQLMRCAECGNKLASLCRCGDDK